jgi:hypothetical protein
MAAQMESYIKQVRKEGDTVGGVVTCVIKNVPIGLGEPVFDKLHATLGQAMLSINAVKGFEYGSGFAGAKRKEALITTYTTKTVRLKLTTQVVCRAVLATVWTFISTLPLNLLRPSCSIKKPSTKKETRL